MSKRRHALTIRKDGEDKVRVGWNAEDRGFQGNVTVNGDEVDKNVFELNLDDQTVFTLKPNEFGFQMEIVQDEEKVFAGSVVGDYFFDAGVNDNWTAETAASDI